MRLGSHRRQTAGEPANGVGVQVADPDAAECGEDVVVDPGEPVVSRPRRDLRVGLSCLPELFCEAGDGERSVDRDAVAPACRAAKLLDFEGGVGLVAGRELAVDDPSVEPAAVLEHRTADARFAQVEAGDTPTEHVDGGTLNGCHGNVSSVTGSEPCALCLPVSPLTIEAKQPVYISGNIVSVSAAGAQVEPVEDCRPADEQPLPVSRDVAPEPAATHSAAHGVLRCCEQVSDVACGQPRVLGGLPLVRTPLVLDDSLHERAQLFPRVNGERRQEAHSAPREGRPRRWPNGRKNASAISSALTPASPVWGNRSSAHEGQPGSTVSVGVWIACLQQGVPPLPGGAKPPPACLLPRDRRTVRGSVFLTRRVSLVPRSPGWVQRRLPRRKSASRCSRRLPSAACPPSAGADPGDDVLLVVARDDGLDAVGFGAAELHDGALLPRLRDRGWGVGAVARAFGHLALPLTMSGAGAVGKVPGGHAIRESVQRLAQAECRHRVEMTRPPLHLRQQTIHGRGFAVRSAHGPNSPRLRRRFSLRRASSFEA